MTKGYVKSVKKHERRSTRLVKPARNSSVKDDKSEAILTTGPEPASDMILEATSEGITALSQLLNNLEAGPGATIVVAHRLDPELQRKLGTLLSGHSHTQITEAMYKLQKEFVDVEKDLKQRTAEVNALKIELASMQNALNDVRRNNALLLLQKSTEQQFLDIAHDMLMVLDVQGHVVMMGKSGCELLGWSEEEIVGTHWIDRFVVPSYATVARTIFDQILQGTLDDEYEYPVVSRGGEERIISWCSSVLRDESGNATGMVCSGEDLTMLRQIHGALQRNEERFHLMMESVREDEFFIMDNEGYIISWIARPEEEKSFRAQEIVGQHFSRLYSADDFQSGKPMRILEIAGNEGRFEEDGWRVRKDGTRMRAYVIVSAIRDDARNLLGFSNVTRYLRERVDVKEMSIYAPPGMVITP